VESMDFVYTAKTIYVMGMPQRRWMHGWACHAMLRGHTTCCGPRSATREMSCGGVYASKG
jgi:hypothetical protein